MTCWLREVSYRRRRNLLLGLDLDGGDRAVPVGPKFGEHLHRFDQLQDLARQHRLSDRDERWGVIAAGP